MLHKNLPRILQKIRKWINIQLSYLKLVSGEALLIDLVLPEVA